MPLGALQPGRDGRVTCMGLVFRHRLVYPPGGDEASNQAGSQFPEGRMRGFAYDT
jgi:hypothetical protein